MQNIRNWIQNRKFEGLEDFDIAKAFNLCCIHEEANFVYESFFALFRSIISEVIFRKNCLRRCAGEKEPIIFIFDTTYNERRKDYEALFEDISNCCTHRQYWRIEKSNRKLKNVTIIITLIFCLLNWLKGLFVNNTLSLKQKMVVLRLLLIAKNTVSMFDRCPLLDVKLLVVFFDASLKSNLLVQLYKKHSILTATVQHGVMLSFRSHKNIDFAAPEFSSFISDYFLIWNIFTYNQAVKFGIPKHKLKILGVSRCMRAVKKQSNQSINVFGVILDGAHTSNNNSLILDFAEYVSQTRGMKYLIRKHPNDPDFLYASFIKKGGCCGYSDTSTIDEYVRTVSFSLVCNSTVLFELPFYHHAFYRISPANVEIDKYIDSNIQTIRKKADFDEYDLDGNMAIACIEFCSVKDVVKSYACFFNGSFD